MYQAWLLNKAGTQLDVVVGLCVGHYMLFTKNSKAYVTTPLVKDRMTGNGTIGPLHSGFFTKMLKRY